MGSNLTYGFYACYVSLVQLFLVYIHTNFYWHTLGSLSDETELHIAASGGCFVGLGGLVARVCVRYVCNTTATLLCTVRANANACTHTHAFSAQHSF